MLSGYCVESYGALRGLPESLAELVSDVSDGVLRERPGDRKWSVKEHIEHLRVADEFFSARITAMLNEDAPFLADRDDDLENLAIFDQVCRNLRDVEQNPEWEYVVEGPEWRGHRVLRW